MQTSTTKTHISLRAIARDSWRTFRSHIWLFLGISVVLLILTFAQIFTNNKSVPEWISLIISISYLLVIILSIKKTLDTIRQKTSNLLHWKTLLLTLLQTIFIWFIMVMVMIIAVAIPAVLLFLGAGPLGSQTLGAGVSGLGITAGIIVGTGMMIAMVRLSFWLISLIDEPAPWLKPIVTSWKLTKYYFWVSLGFILATILIVLLSLSLIMSPWSVLQISGLILTIPASLLLIISRVHLYLKMRSAQTPEEVLATDDQIIEVTPEEIDYTTIAEDNSEKE